LIDADVLALFGRLHELASRVIDDAISEFARAMLADAFCVAESPAGRLAAWASHRCGSPGCG
jgi:hypothetical protein